MTASKKSSFLPLLGLSFFGFILIGASAGASGVLLPSQIAYYHVNKSIIGLLFFGVSIGYFLSAVSAGFFTQRMGQHWYLTTGAAILLASTFAFSLKPPFILLLATSLFLGFGTAIIDAGYNAAIAALPDSTKLLNYLHAFFGVGALLGPLVASTFLAIHWEWNTVYLAWCGLSLLLLIGSVVLLRFLSPSVSTHQAEQHIAENVTIAVLKLAAVWLGALFLFLYVGTEISVGNWSYSFLLEDRHQGTLLAGWVVSGYWFGLTLGRFLINTIAERLHLGIAAMLYACLIGIGISALLVWFIPSLQILGFCLIGFFMGPIFPSMIAVVPYLVPGRLVPSAIGFLVGTSVVGGALFPWLVGTLAQYIGIWALLPCTIALTVIMFSNWWAITRRFATSRS